MINLNCYSCHKQFSFRQSEEGKSFCCPNCGKYSLVSSTNCVSLPDDLKLSRETLASFLTPMELHKIKADNQNIFFRRLQFCSLAIFLIAISYFLIPNKSEELPKPSTSLDKQHMPHSLPSTAFLPIVENEKMETTPIGLLYKNIPNEISDNNHNSIVTKAERKKPEIAKHKNKELNSVEIMPEPSIKKPEFLEFNMLNFTDRKIFIKHKSATNIFLISSEEYPEYIEGDSYFLEPSAELFIKVKNEEEISYSLIYFGEKKDHEFKLIYDNLKIVLKLGKLQNAETIEYSLLSIETSSISGILHTIPKAKEIVVKKEEAKKVVILPLKEENEEEDVRKITKVVKVYNIQNQDQIVYRNYCSGCENYYTGLHTCNSQYINLLPNLSHHYINHNHSSLNYYFNVNDSSCFQRHSHAYTHSLRPHIHNNLFNRSSSVIRVIKR